MRVAVFVVCVTYCLQALESDVQDREGALLEWEKRCKVLERRLAWERATFGLERENLRYAAHVA